MFETLNDKFEKIVRGIRGKAVISESDLDSTLREIRIALLEADVALVVVKDFINSVKENILGKEVLKSIKPDQMIIKLVQDELVNILGSENQPVIITSLQLTKILFCGLQGSGKTTSVAKLANHLKLSSKKKILLASTDIYRPAAQEQLKILAEQIDVVFFNNNLSSAIESMTLLILSLTGDPLASGTFKSNLINTVLFSVLNFLIFSTLIILFCIIHFYSSITHSI